MRSDRKIKTIPLVHILYIESLSDYVKIHIKNQPPIVTKEKISKLADQLPNTFIRIHSSYIVNKNTITSFTKNTVHVENIHLTISRTYKKIAYSDLMETSP